jgi:uncharacterized protein (DUF302 family)
MIGSLDYGFTRTFEGVPLAEARKRVEAALREEGFGILTEIDVKATLKQKLGVDFPNYVILGACNPNLAHQSLTTEPGIGLLLPCNVVVTEDGRGNGVVAIMDPEVLVRTLPDPAIFTGPMHEARNRLERALNNA